MWWGRHRSGCPNYTKSGNTYKFAKVNIIYIKKLKTTLSVTMITTCPQVFRRGESQVGTITLAISTILHETKA